LLIIFFNYLFLKPSIIKIKDIFILGIGDWGLGIGDWGFGPKTKNPKPKPQTQNPKLKYYKYK